jgi:hypothetical protein
VKTNTKTSAANNGIKYKKYIFLKNFNFINTCSLISLYKKFNFLKIGKNSQKKVETNVPTISYNLVNHMQ